MATSPLPGSSPVRGKSLMARFDGGQLSSDGGLLALRPLMMATGKEIWQLTLLRQ